MIRLRYFLLTLLCGIVFYAKATHNRAGEISYKWLSGFTYEIKVTTYTNINGSNLADRCEDTVYFGDGTKAVVLRSNGALTGGCAPAKDGQPLPGNMIKLNEYVTSHTYPGPGSYKISMEDPNRNAGIINIPNSVNQVFYIESLLVIPTFGTGKNNSPGLTFPPIDNGCVSRCFNHNPGAYDIDGDSLSYELTTCRGHLGATCPGYTYPTSGGGVFRIDSLNGTLEWCNPQMQGEYNLAILIREWRKDGNCQYSLIGYVLRDLQVDVGLCSNSQPVINPVSSVYVMAGSVVTKTITATDPDPDVLTMETKGGPFSVSAPAATFSSAASLTPVTGLFNWQTTIAHARKEPYQLTIKVQDNDPSVVLVHFKSFEIHVMHHGPFNLTTTSYYNNILLKWNKPANYLTTGPGAFLHYRIYRKTGLSTWVPAANETAPPAYTGFVYLGSTPGNITDTTYYDFNNSIPFVAGQDYSYVVLAEYADCSYSYVSNIAANQIYVGIKEEALSKSDVQTFPNPAGDDLAIVVHSNKKQRLDIELMDVTGRTIKIITSQENITQQQAIHLNLESINPGIYFLKVTADQHNTVTKKIIKQ